MSHVQVKALEALSKGYVPSGYNIVTETGKKLTDEGYTTGQLSTGSFYRDDGSVMSADGRTCLSYTFSAAEDTLSLYIGRCASTQHINSHPIGVNFVSLYYKTPLITI